LANAGERAAAVRSLMKDADRLMRVLYWSKGHGLVEGKQQGRGHKTSLSWVQSWLLLPLRGKGITCQRFCRENMAANFQHIG